MTIQFVSTTAPAASASPQTVTAPAGIATGDVMLMMVYGLVEVPDGWATIPGAEIYGDGDVTIFVRTVEASEPADYTVVATSGGLITGIVAFTSDAASPIRVDVADVQANAASGDRTWPVVTLSASESMIAAFAYLGSNLGTTPTAGYTERWDTLNPRQYLMTGPVSGAGSFGPLVASGSSSTSFCVIVALNEGTQTPFEGPQYRAYADTAYGNVNGSISVTVPAAVEVGDYLLASLVFGTDKTPTFPDGWEAVETVTGTDNIYVYGKVAEAGDLGASITPTFAAGTVAACLGLVAYFSPRGRVLAVDASDSQSNASSTDVTFASVTPVADLVGMAYFAHMNGSFNTAPDDLAVERWERSSGSKRSYAMTELWRDGGATGTRTATRSSAGTSSTVTVAVRELPPDCRPHVGYVYNGVDITDYCNAIEVKNSMAERERKTLGSTGLPFRAGLADSVVLLKGDWNATVDALLGRDAFLGTKRTGVATFDDCTYQVSYTWTSGARVSSWKVTTAAPGKIEWQATVHNHVIGVRSVTLD